MVGQVQGQDEGPSVPPPRPRIPPPIFMPLLWPSLAGGDSEEGEQRPEHIVVVKLILLPLPLLCLHLIVLLVDQVFPPGRGGGGGMGWGAAVDPRPAGPYLQSFSNSLDSSVQ